MNSALFAAAVGILLFASSFGQAMADGGGRDIIPSPPIGNRNPLLSVQLNPPILTEGDRSDTFMQLRFFDDKTNQTIVHTSFFIQVTKSDKEYTLGTFHAHNGILTLKLQPAPGPVVINANEDPFLPDTWIADPNGIVNVKGPLLLESGLYGLHVEIPVIDNDGYLFSEASMPKFNTDLSVGDVSYHDMQYGGSKYNTTLISYYDSIRDFGFDPAQKSLTWKMPFDWNATRISTANTIFVHEELKLAQPLYDGMVGKGVLNAVVNGVPLDNSRIIVDPYSSPGFMIVHYIIPRNDLVELSKKVPTGTLEMQFSLAPERKAIETSTNMITDAGRIEVLVGWSPSDLKGNAESTTTLHFVDAASGLPVKANVNYDIAIYKDEKLVLEKKDLVAAGGLDSQKVTFPTDDVYSIEVKVKGLSGNGTTPDYTRNGVARGTVVVPEFPYSLLAASLSVALAVALLQARTWSAKGK